MCFECVYCVLFVGCDEYGGWYLFYVDCCYYVYVGYCWYLDVEKD